MNILLELVAAAVGIVSIICLFIILIDAFKDAIWKGVVCLLCGFYWLYYALFEFEHDNKWVIVILALGGGAISGGILSLTR